MVSILQDFPMSPDMVSRVKVLTSSYAPEYGSSPSANQAVTKSGGSTFHGAAFEFHQDNSLTATQWGGKKATFATRTTSAPTSAGPSRCPASPPTGGGVFFFYFDIGGDPAVGRRVSGGALDPIDAGTPGDFRDWRDPSGNLIPIYDPATLRPDGRGSFIKDQFMGCDGNTPNVICPDRINPLVAPWLAALPTPTSPGALNNFLAPPIPDTILGDSNYYMGRVDVQAGSDHVFASFWHRRAPAKFYSQLPQAIATETYSDPQNSWVNRMNFDKILTSTLVNHMSAGYLNRNEGYGCINQDLQTSSHKSRGLRATTCRP